MKAKKFVILFTSVIFSLTVFASCSSKSTSDDVNSVLDTCSDIQTDDGVTTEDVSDILLSEENENSVIENSDGTQKVYNIDKADKSEETKLTPQEQENLKQEILSLIDQLKENE